VRRLAWLLPFLLAGVVLSACDDGVDPRDVVVGAADAAVHAATAKVRVTGLVEGQRELRTAADGVYDFQRRRGSFSSAVEGQSFESVVARSVVYSKVGRLDGFDTDWVSLDIARLDADPWPGLAALALDAVTSDPGMLLDYLRGAVEVRERGSADVRGVPTTRYRAAVDLDAAAAAVPADRRLAARRAARLLGTDSQRMDVWIDDEGRVRRLVVPFDYAAMELPEELDRAQLPDVATVTIDYFDFGDRVVVHTPDFGQFTDLTDEHRPVEPTPAHAALERLLVTDLPPGYQLEPDDIGTTGPTDREKAARDSYAEDADAVRRALRGFVAGYQRLWMANDGYDQVTVQLYEFETAAGAEAFSRLVDADPNDGTEPFEVVGVAGARGTMTQYEHGSTSVAQVAVGTYAVRVQAAGRTTTPAMVSDLLAQQVSRLGLRPVDS
jgi:hypothetical protein